MNTTADPPSPLTEPSVIVRGRWLRFVPDLLLLSTLAILVIWSTDWSQSSLQTIVLLVLLAPMVRNTASLVLRPPRLEVRGTKFGVHFGNSHLVLPIEDLGNLTIYRRQLVIVPLRFDRIEPATASPGPGQQIQFGGDFFRAEHVNRIRRTIGAPELEPGDVIDTKFNEIICARTPIAWVTPTLIAANIAVLVAMAIAGVSPLQPDVQSLLEWGGNFAPKTVSGEWWRLLTAMFLHVGVLHLGFNMFALSRLGPQTERIAGNWHYLAVYLFSGIVSSITSIQWQSQSESYSVGVGASGAVFGLFGALLALAIRERTQAFEELHSLRRTCVILLALNLLIGLSIPNIDMAAHVGGFLAGFALWWTWPPSLSVAPPVIRRRALWATLAMIGIVALGWSALPDMGADQRAQELLDRWQSVEVQHDNGDITDEEWRRTIADDLLPAAEKIGDELQRLAERSDSRRRQYLSERWQLVLEYGRFARDGDRTGLRKTNAKIEQLDNEYEGQR